MSNFLNRTFKIVICVVFVPCYIYLTGYGIGYLTGSHYQLYSSDVFQWLLIFLEIMRWLLLLLLIYWWAKFKKTKGQTNE